MTRDRASTLSLAGLVADDYGTTDGRPPLVLLHGLTFDRTMWRPALDELDYVDPGRRVITLDLPGHGDSPGWSSYDLTNLADGVHRLVEEAHLGSPVVVGHSMSAIIATVYAALYRTRGVVNVDQSLQIGTFARLVQPLADQLRGQAFTEVWQMVATTMHIELLPEDAQELLRSHTTPGQNLVTGYWRELLDRPIAELVALFTTALIAVRTAQVPYLVVAGEEPEPAYQDWLKKTLPQATTTVWPGSGHFPHLAHPGLFAHRLAATAHWPEPPVDMTSGPHPFV
ncbi:MAG: alpha/beta fold hydrolase [Acidimicrobiales bacterium]